MQTRMVIGWVLAAAGLWAAEPGKPATKARPSIAAVGENGQFDPSKLPPALRERFEKLPPELQKRFMQMSPTERARFAERFGAATGKMAPVDLPKNVEWTPVKHDSGQTDLTLRDQTKLGKPVTPVDLDALMADELQKEGLTKSTPRVTDDRLVRRIYLDVIGRLPAPADINEYVDSSAPDKKSQLIDRLLSMPQFGENWSRYWTQAITYHATASRNRWAGFDFEPWLETQFNDNRTWAQIATDMLTAIGNNEESPQGLLLAVHEGKAEELAGEVSRLFLGVQISCANCHDHPSDVWKREQFHEFASFFAKVKVRPRRDPNGGVMPGAAEIFSTDFADYRMPDLKNPSAPGKQMSPAFLSGQPIPDRTTDEQRRQAAAQFVTSKRNPYFAKAFVNRVWAEMMGFGFTHPVDDLGVNKTVVYPAVFDELSRSFAADDYNIKNLFRLILNSRVYDRQFHDVADYSTETLFAAIAPAKLTADQVLDALDWVLGGIDDGRKAMNGPRQQSGRGQFREVFGYDPSESQDNLEGSIPQALTMMNHPTVNQRISAVGANTLLSKLLRTQKDDAQLVEMLYLRTLARKPTAQESETCLAHVKKIGRSEGFEDVLWGLLNTSEFLHNQ